MKKIHKDNIQQKFTRKFTTKPTTKMVQGKSEYFQKFNQAQEDYREEGRQYEQHLTRQLLEDLNASYATTQDPTMQPLTREDPLNNMTLLMPHIDQTGLDALLTLSPTSLREILLQVIDKAQQQRIEYVENLRIEQMERDQAAASMERRTEIVRVLEDGSDPILLARIEAAMRMVRPDFF